MLDLIARQNPEYVDALYRDYRRDPRAVDERWALFFAGYDFGSEGRGVSPAGAEVLPGVSHLVHSYRELGHLVADLDPLGHSRRTHPLLALDEFGIREEDLDRIVDCAGFRGCGRGPLRALIAALQETYGRTLAVEYLGVPDKERREWLEERMEPPHNRPALSAEHRLRILEQLMAAEQFEQFLHTKYVGAKRFSLEGGEALIALLHALIDEAVALDVEQLVMGMPHRGRLNVLAHVLKKPYEIIGAEFEGSVLPPDVQGDGDVKYHLGYSHDHEVNGRRIHLSLSPNPSHLEAVNPVVEGIVRAKQSYLGDTERRRVVPVLLHGEAAFLGQGSVYETLAPSQLPSFTTGGTIHVIVNNQIGFTTSPIDYLFTCYATDPAKMVQAPVFHVNSDDPEAAVQAARLAMGYRQAFRGDVFIDLVCYRRHGHNELDDPTLTQPVMYREIRDHPPVTELYRRRLVDGGAADEERIAAIRDRVKTTLTDALSPAREVPPREPVFAFGGVWAGLTWAGEDWSAETAVGSDRLREIAHAVSTVPADFTPHRRVRKLLDERRAMVERGEGIDWGGGEILAYGSLLREGIPVRLCGQDSVRGTFSHRHGVLFDAQTGSACVPLNHLAPDQASIEFVNSPLSEEAVLGFEYGVSSADPRRLVIWEAQFGDFFNAAQVIVDQFIASGESKWQRMSGLVLFLPHGYEGQGPEHSSARPERFLQLCAERNMQVVNCTTPAQLFHALRRQMRRSFRKPLVVLTPKSLLRHPRAVSTLAEFTDGRFQPLLGDPRELDAQRVTRVLLCCGKIFYALDARREERHWNDVAILRLEELYPFPAAELTSAIQRYPQASDLCWVQEEPANQGGWSFLRPRVEELLHGEQRLRYIGRDEAASPATGSYKIHQAEETAILEEAFSRPRPLRRSPGIAGSDARRASA